MLQTLQPVPPISPPDEKYVSSIHGLISFAGGKWTVTLCGVYNLEIVHLLRNSPVPLQQDVLTQSSQGELLWYFHTLTVFTRDRVRVFEAASTKNQHSYTNILPGSWSNFCLPSVLSAWQCRKINRNFHLLEILVFPSHSQWGIRRKSWNVRKQKKKISKLQIAAKSWI